MKTIFDSCSPRQKVLEGKEEFVVNLAKLPSLDQQGAIEFLDSNVVTSGMNELAQNVFRRVSGEPSSGIFKLTESMGGGKTQSLIFLGVLSRFPELVDSAGFLSNPSVPKDIEVVSFTGRDTDQVVWNSLSNALGRNAFDEGTTPSERQWVERLKGRKAVILLDELSFYLVNATTRGSVEEGNRFAIQTGQALTNLFGAVRDYEECSQVALVVSDLQKDWEQGEEKLSQIMKSNALLGSAVQSTDNEMSKGAVSISPVDNSKGELYDILRKRLFSEIDASESQVSAIAEAYRAALKAGKDAGLITQPLNEIDNQLRESYPFHFSTKQLIEGFNSNPGFQKTRDAIRLMAYMVRSLWNTRNESLSPHLISLTSPDFNDSPVASRFKAAKASLEGALQTDVADSGKSHAEQLDAETNGLASHAAKWIFIASLGDPTPLGIRAGELAAYIASPEADVSGLSDTLKRLSQTCWYLEQHRDGRYYFHRERNLNAQISSFEKNCPNSERDEVIRRKIEEMYSPRDGRCYQKAVFFPSLEMISLERDKCTLVFVEDETTIKDWFAKQHYKNRVFFISSCDPSGLFSVRRYARRVWAASEVVKDLGKDHANFEKAKQELANNESELFLGLRGLYTKLSYPLWDPSSGETELTGTDLLDHYVEEQSGNKTVYDSKQASKGEFVVENTLLNAGKFQRLDLSNFVQGIQPLRSRFETMLFPSTKRASWENIKEAAATTGKVFWVENKLIDRMKDSLIKAGEWREEANQILVPPFKEITGVTAEVARDAKTGTLTTQDLALRHGDELYVREDGGEWRKIPSDAAFQSSAMLIEFECRDSKGKNQTGKPFKYQNAITIDYDLLPGASGDSVTIKVRVVPVDSTLRFSTDGTDPMNHGDPYSPPGIPAPKGSTVRLFAEKGVITESRVITVPSDTDTDDQSFDPELPARLKGSGMKSHLADRRSVHEFLNNLPMDVGFLGARLTVQSPDGDKYRSYRCDNNHRVAPAELISVLGFLDDQVEEGDWSMSFLELFFPSGRELIEWQIGQSVKIEANLISQP